MDAPDLGVLRLLPFIFVGIGLLFMVIGVVLAVRLRLFRRTAVRVPGVVTDVVYQADVGYDASGRRRTGGMWFPVLSFTTMDGRPVRTRAHYGRNLARPRPGDQVTVLYDPEDVTRAALPRDGPGCLAVGFVLLGLSFAAVGALVLVLFSAIPSG